MKYLKYVVAMVVSGGIVITSAVAAGSPEACGAGQACEKAAACKEGAVDARQTDAYQKRWFFYWGAANMHAGLKDSEAQIDRQLNKGLGSLIPHWEKPVTFGDWSDDFKLWDFHVGVGRDISPRWSWFFGTGGTVGTVKNEEDYMLPIPLWVQADFTRRIKFLVTGLTCYPWGKPVYEYQPGTSRLKASLCGTRPVVEVATSYVRLKTVADIKLRVPNIATIMKKYEEHDYDLFYISPRLGLEMPLGKNDTLTFQAGYIFFNKYQSEVNNYSFYLLHKHKF